MRKLTEKEIQDSGLTGYTRYWVKNGKIYGAQNGEQEAHLIKGAYLHVVIDEKVEQAGKNMGRGKEYYDWLHNN